MDQPGAQRLRRPRVHRGRGSVRRLVRLVAVLAIVAATLTWAAPALATPSLQVVPDRGLPGDSLTATASGNVPNEVITYWWDGTSLLGTDMADRFGVAILVFRIPQGAAFGDHFVRACQATSCSPGTFDDARVVVGPSSTPTAAPTSTPRPTPRPTTSPQPTAGLTPGPTPAPTPTPGTTGPVVPVPSFPIGGPSPTPAALPFLAITPAPQPPGGEAAPETTFPNLIAADIEVTQGIQNLDNDMPLVDGRRTYARVYIDLALADSWPNTWGALEARRGGQQIGWIWPDNGPITARAGGGERTDLDDSLQFRLPASWTSGTVTLTAFVFSYTIETPFTEEPNADDNFRSVTVRFDEGLPLTLHLAPLHLHRSFHPTDIERIYFSDAGGDFVAPGANVGGTNRILSGVYRYLPLTTVNVDSFNAPVFPLGHAGGHEFDLGGICKTSLVEWSSDSHIVLTDWTVLMEDPTEIDPNGSGDVVPDRAEVRVMDRTFTVSHFYPRDDGTGDLYGSSDKMGPQPVPGAPAYAHRCLILVDDLHESNQTLALYRVFYDWQDERELFVGMIDPTLRTAFSGGIATWNTDSISTRMTDSFDTSWPWWHSGAETIAHEAAHQAGLGHVPCQDDDGGGIGDGIPDEIDGGDLDPTHPMTLTFPDCWLSDIDPEGYYGFDVYWDRFGLPAPSVVSNDPGVAAPYRAFPLLSYEFPGWPDPYHYCRLLTYYGVPCSPSALDLPWNPPNPKPDGSDPFTSGPPAPENLQPGVDAAMVLVTESGDDGWSLELLARNSTPTLDLRQRIAAAQQVEPDDGRPFLVVLGPDGEPTWQASIPTADLPHGASGNGPIAMVVPLPPDATAVAVRGWDYTSKAKVEGSGAPPVVTRLTVESDPGNTGGPDDEVLLFFAAGDPDGDRLTFTLLYTPDGDHWQVVRTGMEGRQVRVPVADLPSGDAPAFRLVAFDGWSAGEARVTAPRLATPRNPPTVRILAGGPATYPLGSRVRLDATAFDLEDRALPRNAITWESSIDGPLGGGSEIATRELSAGRHTITAVATDSDGLAGRATYVLDIDPSVIEARPGAAVEAGIAGIFERLAAGKDPAPAQPGTVKVAFPWLPAAVVVLFIAVAGVAASRWIRMAQPSGGTAAPAIHGQKDQSLEVEHDATPAAPGDDVTLKGSNIKEN